MINKVVQAGLLVCIIMLMVIYQLTTRGEVLFILLLLLGTYLILSLHQLTRIALLLLFISALVTGLVVFRLPTPLVPLREASTSFGFLAAFIATLTLLRIPAYRSRIMRQCGHVILSQPPGRRYPLLSIGTMLFGVVLNMGVLNLSASMMDKANSLEAAKGREWLRNLRRKRMLLAALRGFALLPLVTPMGVGVAIILASMPTLGWAQLYLYTFTVATLIFLLGWLSDYLGGPHPLKPPAVADRHSLMPLLNFALVLIGLVALVFICAWILQLRLPQAVLIGVPLGCLIWLGVQLRSIGLFGVAPAIVLITRRLPAVLGSIGNEVVLLGAGAYLGKLSVSLVGPEVLSGILGMGTPAAASLAMLLMVTMSLLGLNPIITASFVASAVSRLDIPDISLPAMATAILTGWALAAACSPFTASMIILSRVTGLSPSRIGLRWNGKFVGCCLLGGMIGFFIFL